MSSWTVVYTCPYEGCAWSLTEVSALDITENLDREAFNRMLARGIEDTIKDRMERTESEIRKHLDEAHAGWTIEEIESLTRTAYTYPDGALYYAPDGELELGIDPDA